MLHLFHAGTFATCFLQQHAEFKPTVANAYNNYLIEISLDRCST